MIRIIKMIKTRRLCHVYLFLQMPMQEGIFGTKLVNGPITHRGQGENDLYSRWLNYGTEGLTIVQLLRSKKDVKFYHKCTVVNRST